MTDTRINDVAVDPESRIASYLAQQLQTPLPAEVMTRARLHLLDTLAAILSGRFLSAGDFAYRFAEQQGAAGNATLLGSTRTTGLELAAFANAMAAHADETDDSHVGGRFHPGCAIVPAALAVAEQEGSTHTEILAAIVAGYDIGARATQALGFASPKTTRFSTHSFGALFGAAAATAILLRLSVEQCHALLSFTVQQASGLSYWNRDPDHVEKSFDFGAKAARNGVFASLLAKAGMRAPDRPLCGANGYLDAFAERAQPEALCDGLGERYEIQSATIKKWSVGSPIQSVLDAVETLFAGKPIAADTISRIDVQLPSNRIHVVDDRAMPAVCCQHLVALALLDGRVSYAASHDMSRMTCPYILALRAKIRLIADDALSAARPERQAIVTVTMVGGEVLQHHAKIVRGTPDDPMSEAEVAAKVQDILHPVLADRSARLTALCLDEPFDARMLVNACLLPQRDV